jgi:hypothetical protein
MLDYAERTENEESELARLRRENDFMRKLIADSDLPCVYCGLSRDDMGKCLHGFPGCARADDMMH